MGIIEKHVFLDQCCQDLDVKFLGEIKGILQFHAQRAACSHELCSKVLIDAGGERAAEGRKSESECGSLGSVQSVLRDHLQRETELQKLLHQH